MYLESYLMQNHPSARALGAAAPVDAAMLAQRQQELAGQMNVDTTAGPIALDLAQPSVLKQFKGMMRAALATQTSDPMPNAVVDEPTWDPVTERVYREATAQVLDGQRVVGGHVVPTKAGAQWFLIAAMAWPTVTSSYVATTWPAIGQWAVSGFGEVTVPPMPATGKVETKKSFGPIILGSVAGGALGFMAGGPMGAALGAAGGAGLGAIIA